jgi:putative phage-type endonuclease
MTSAERAAWLAERRKGIGGSDAAAVCGLSPFTDPLQVWLDKTGQMPPREMTLPQKAGIALEPIIRDEYASKMHVEVVKVPMAWSAEFKWMLVNLDGYIPSLKAGFEAKSSESYEGWGKPGTDQIPMFYKVQVYHGMIVTGLRIFHVAVLIRRRDFWVYEVPFDARYAQAIIETERLFWHEFVLKGVAPKPGDLDSMSEILRQMFPREKRPLFESLHPGVMDLLRRAFKAKRALQEADRSYRAVKNETMFLLKDAEGIKVPGIGQAKWTKNADGQQVDWHAVSAEAGVSQALIDKHTRPTEGARVLRFKDETQEEEEE